MGKPVCPLFCMIYLQIADDTTITTIDGQSIQGPISIYTTGATISGTTYTNGTLLCTTSQQIQVSTCTPIEDAIILPFTVIIFLVCVKLGSLWG